MLINFFNSIFFFRIHIPSDRTLGIIFFSQFFKSHPKHLSAYTAQS